MPVFTQNILQKYIEEICCIYGDHVRQIILFGSYARGDFHEDSDIDIMILTDMDPVDEKVYGNKLSDITFDYLMDYDVDIKPMAVNENHFNSWYDVYPFYKNVNTEGIRLYAAWW